MQSISISNAFNAFNAMSMYVKAVNTHTHISAHSFLNIKVILNPKKVLKS